MCEHKETHLCFSKMLQEKLMFPFVCMANKLELPKLFSMDDQLDAASSLFWSLFDAQWMLQIVQTRFSENFWHRHWKLQTSIHIMIESGDVLSVVSQHVEHLTKADAWPYSRFTRHCFEFAKGTAVLNKGWADWCLWSSCKHGGCSCLKISKKQYWIYGHLGTAYFIQTLVPLYKWHTSAASSTQDASIAECDFLAKTPSSEPAHNFHHMTNLV